jgi:hypothetical protein
MVTGTRATRPTDLAPRASAGWPTTWRRLCRTARCSSTSTRCTTSTSSAAARKAGRDRRWQVRTGTCGDGTRAWATRIDREITPVDMEAVVWTVARARPLLTVVDRAYLRHQVPHRSPWVQHEFLYALERHLGIAIVSIPGAPEFRATGDLPRHELTNAFGLNGSHMVLPTDDVAGSRRVGRTDARDRSRKTTSAAPGQRDGGAWIAWIRRDDLRLFPSSE